VVSHLAVADNGEAVFYIDHQMVFYLHRIQTNTTDSIASNLPARTQIRGIVLIDCHAINQECEQITHQLLGMVDDGTNYQSNQPDTNTRVYGLVCWDCHGTVYYYVYHTTHPTTATSTLSATTATSAMPAKWIGLITCPFDSIDSSPLSQLYTDGTVFYRHTPTHYTAYDLMENIRLHYTEQMARELKKQVDAKYNIHAVYYDAIDLVGADESTHRYSVSHYMGYMLGLDKTIDGIPMIESSYCVNINIYGDTKSMHLYMGLLEGTVSAWDVIEQLDQIPCEMGRENTRKELIAHMYEYTQAVVGNREQNQDHARARYMGYLLAGIAGRVSMRAPHDMSF
jgi:hypothetical protein